MSRSTRARLRSESQRTPSQQKQTTRPKQLQNAHQSVDQSLQSGLSYASVSTATLPDQHTVFQAALVGQTIPTEDVRDLYVKGAEIISDAWRRGGKEGVLDKSVKRRKLNDEQRLEAVRDGKLWYTAPYMVSSTGELTVSRRSWSPRIAPPLNDTLPSLEHQPVHLIPPVGPNLLPWSTRLGDYHGLGHSPLVDFASGWNRADGTGWGEPAKPLEDSSRGGGIRWSCDAITESPDASAPAVARKPPRADCADRTSHRARMSWWRAEIRAEPGYDRLTTIIPRPHGLDPRPMIHPSSKSSRKRKMARPPDYILPRFYSIPSFSGAHPLHPDLDSYLALNHRVYWAIPIVGPVQIPGWSDHLTTPGARKAPIPTSGTLTSSLDPDASFTRHLPSSLDGAMPVLSKPRPKSLVWTDALLRHFWDAFLLPLYADSSFPFGSLSVRLSGPKPDPHLQLPSPAPLKPWPTTNTDPLPRQAALPVRPEMGDHIRLYCDSKHALSLRTWLNSVEVEMSSFASPDQHIPFPTPHLPFEKVRLVLVGPLGEAVIVA